MEQEFIGEGTTRVAYLIGDGLVKKVHTHWIGYEQSKNEYEIWSNLPDRWKPYFNEILEVTEEYQICRYCAPYTGDSEVPYDLTVLEDEFIPYTTVTDENGYALFCEEEDAILRFLESYGVVIGELYGTSNLSVVDGRLVFIDYGMTASLMNDIEFGIELGEIAYFAEDWCIYCKEDTRIKHLGEVSECMRCRNII